MIKATQTAIDRIKDGIEEMDVDVKEPYIRLHMGIGWGGPRLQLALEESSNPQDRVTEIEGINFLVAENQTPYFENVKLDFTKNLFGFGEFKLITV